LERAPGAFRREVALQLSLLDALQVQEPSDAGAVVAVDRVESVKRREDDDGNQREEDQ
jgi:hypothetical protein